MDNDPFSSVCQLPEYCPETDGVPRPLVIIRTSGNAAVESILAAAKQRQLAFQHRLLEHAEGTCLVVVGPAEGNTDQFLRSLCYVLQQAAGDGEGPPDILENRLVPQSFTLFGGEGADSRSLQLQTPAHRFGLRMSGSTSFGSGFHPSTRLAVRALESLQNRHQGKGFAASALDVGCGSGILALICARLGARQVLAVDRDRQALAAAARNVEANGLQGIVRVESTAVEDIAPAWQLVVANLAVSVLHVLLEDLVRLVAQQGFLILAGFQKGQGEKILIQAKQKGMVLLEEGELDGWRSFLFQKTARGL